MRALTLCAIVALLSVQALAISIKWTGYASNQQWTTNNNWYPNQVPGPNDDVTIDSGIVQVTIPTGVNSLVMGTQFQAPANLTIFYSFLIGTGGLTVEGNGNLILTAGTANVQGAVNIGGNLYFSSGTIGGGTWTIGSRANAWLNGNTQKALVGCSFQANGPLTFSGNIILNQSSVLTIGSTATASGPTTIVAGDNTQVLFDASTGTFTYTGNGELTFNAPVKLGTFNFNSGNLTLFDAITFVNPFVIPSGSFVSVLNPSVVNMTAGVSGPGVLSVQSAITFGQVNISGTIQLIAGTSTFNGQAWVNYLSLRGATLVINGALKVAMANLISGTISGPNTFAIGKGTFTNNGILIDGPVQFSDTMTTAGTALLTLSANGAIKISGGATLVTTGSSVQFTGPPQNGGVTNDGHLNFTVPTTFQNVALSGLGTVNVATTVSLNTMTISQGKVNLKGSAAVFKGATVDIVRIATIDCDPSVTGRIGSYRFTCPGACNAVTTSGVPPDGFSFTCGSS